MCMSILLCNLVLIESFSFRVQTLYVLLYTKPYVAAVQTAVYCLLRGLEPMERSFPTTDETHTWQ